MFDATPPCDHGDDLSPFDLPEVRARNPSDKDLQRAEGSGRIVLSGSEKGTRIIDVFQQAPIRIIFPSTGGSPAEEAVLVNTAGGIAGGDRLESDVTALGPAIFSWARSMRAGEAQPLRLASAARARTLTASQLFGYRKTAKINAIQMKSFSCWMIRLAQGRKNGAR